MRKPPTRRTLWLGAAVLLLGVVPPAGAHEEAVLSTKNPRVTAGGILVLSGREFSKGGTYELKLAGAVREYALLQVRADSAGAFDLDVPVPSEVVPGAYKVTAVAPDGDVVARLDVEVLGASATSEAVSRTSRPGEETGSEAHDAGTTTARTGDMKIEHGPTVVEWALIVLLIVVAAAGGIALLRRTSPHV